MRQRRNRHGVCAVAGLLVACGIPAGVGVAGAAQQAVEVRIGVTAESLWDPNDPTPKPATTGDEVVWDFTGSAQPHNLKAVSGPAADAAWMDVDTDFTTSGEYRRTFDEPGEFKFRCEVHPPMTGTLVVTREPVEATPTPSPTATPTATPTAPTAQTGSQASAAPADDHATTPAPAGSASADRTAPAVSGLRVKPVRRGARVTLQLSEPATVTLRIAKRASGRVVRTARLQVRPGTRTLTVRGARLERGRYTIELLARDASGNTSTPLRATLRIGRGSSTPLRATLRIGRG